MVERDGRRTRRVVVRPARPLESKPELPPDFPTEALLDDQGAAAAELRADLDRLRRQLDDGPPPLVPPRRRSRRPLLVVLVIGATLVGVAGVIILPGPDLDRDPKPADPSASNRARPEITSAAPPPAPAGRLPATGPGITEPGTMMLVQVAENGSLRVTEQARPGPRGLLEINLRLASMAALSGQAGELTPTVRNLRVRVNGTPVTTTATGRGWAVDPPTGQPVRTVRLSYRIEDAVVRTQPSRSGRALGVSLPLLAQALREQGLPLVVRAEGTAVGGLTCPSAPAAQMLCGQEWGDGWLATIPTEAASPAVLLQLNLN